MNPTDLIHFLLEAADQIRVFHWGTRSYPEHVALGDLYDALSDSADKIAEALMGSKGGERLTLKGSLELVDYTPGAPANYVGGIAEALKSIKGLPTDVLNMRDDLLGTVHKTTYLLTLSAPAAKTEAAEEETGREPVPPPEVAPAETEVPPPAQSTEEMPPL